jgi:hypothetical protein
VQHQGGEHGPEHAGQDGGKHRRLLRNRNSQPTRGTIRYHGT